MLSIPVRSPNLIPIEIIFHQVRNELCQQAWTENITSESFENFKTRIIGTFTNFPSQAIDKIIESMNGRIDLIIKNIGNRIKY